MRKKLSILLTVLLLLAFMLPSGAFAMENTELENAITKAKTLLNITNDYDIFSYSINSQGDLKVYSLYWSDTKQELGQINAGIDSLGRLTSYYSYKPYTTAGSSKLPKISKEDALKASDDFIKKVNPSIVNEIKYQESDSPMYVGDTNYYFSYYRVENGVIYSNNNVNVNVDNRTGEVTNYNCNWTDGLSFPDLNGILTRENAQKAFKEKLGLDLIYKLSYENNKQTPYLAYNVLENNKCIDAKTGEVTPLYSDIYYGGMGNAKAMDTASAAMKEVSLSPEEVNALEIASNFKDEKEAESIARTTLGLDDGYTLNSINLYKVWQSESDYSWNMNFSKGDRTGDISDYLSASATVDAKTGEVTNFYKYVPSDPDTQEVRNQDQCKELAENFIKSIQPEKFSQVEYTTLNQPDVRPLSASEMPRQYDFTFTRKANGVSFPGNGFTLNVDAVTGIVTSYNYTWYKGELPSPNNVITLDQAHNVLFDKIELGLQYIPDYSAASTAASAPMKIMPSPSGNTIPVIKLVYTLDNSKPVNIDAVTGQLLDSSGKPYIEKAVPEYTDIAGNPAEDAIKTIAKYGIGLPGSQYKPEDLITQRDFLFMLARTMGWYTDYEVSDSFDNNLYSYLKSSGIVKDGERNPSSVVAKQDAAKFIVRALRYDRVADLNKLFSLPFSDSSSISENNYGYVAIAYGLNIISSDGGSFNPFKSITRADTAVYLYNLLSTGY